MILNLEALRAAEPEERLRTIGHELVHIILGDLAGEDAHVSFFLHEGLAQLLAGQSDIGQSVRLAWAMLLRKPIPMTDLIFTFPYAGPQTDLAYAQSAAFVRYIAEKELHYDDTSHLFRDFLSNPEKAKTIFARLSDTEIVVEMERNWHGGEKGSRNLLLILSSSGVLWGFMTLLFLYAYLAKRRTRGAVIAEWEPWERENVQDNPVLPHDPSASEEDDMPPDWRSPGKM